MNTKVNILHLEDNKLDAELVWSRLTADGIDADIQWVKNRDDYERAVLAGGLDLVLLDYTMPDYDGMEAVRFLRAREQGVPFIFISGTIGEERAVAVLKEGATDYVLKDNLSRLTVAVRAALREAVERRLLLEAEKRVREQAALLDQASDAMLAVDLEGNVLYWNRSAERLFAGSAPETDRSLREVFHFLDEERFASAWKAVLSSGEWRGDLEWVEEDAPQGKRILETHWTLVPDVAGGGSRVFLVCSDVSDARRFTERLYRLQRLQSLGELAGGIAHDLNNLLGPILLGTEMLEKGTIDDEGRAKVIRMIHDSARRGVEMTRQILSFAGGHSRDDAGVDLNGLLPEMDRFFRQSFPRDIEIESDLAPDLPIVRGGSTRIFQVVMNLCVNARDAMPGGGTLSISARTETLNQSFFRKGEECGPGEYVRMDFKDSGEGMPPEVIEKLFQPFFTTKGENMGTGLGLSTSLRILNENGGCIRVKSEPGRGSVFSVWLPVLGEASRRGFELGSMPPHPIRLLVVDDETSILRLIATVLGSGGYNVSTAVSGVAALHQLKRCEEGFDVMVVDLDMPGMDGPAFVRAARASGVTAPCIGISGLGLELSEDRWSGMADVILTKPFSLQALDKAIRSLLEDSSEATE